MERKKKGGRGRKRRGEETLRKRSHYPGYATGPIHNTLKFLEGL